MVTGEGGCISRMMPPADWDCGPIPEECHNPSLTRREIEDLLRPVYFAEERVRRLADSDDPKELQRARWALETIVEIDAHTIWSVNLTKG